VLVHHPDPARESVGGGGELHRAAIDAHRSRVGAQLAEGDAHERGLPRTVLAEQGVHAAGARMERRLCERVHAAEALRNALERKEGAR
jgi:hypothetical protein